MPTQTEAIERLLQELIHTIFDLIAGDQLSIASAHFLSITWRAAKSLRKIFKASVNGDQDNPPLQFEFLEAENLVVWLLTLRTLKGAPLSYSFMKTHRVGLFNLFREYGVDMPTQLEHEHSHHSRGPKRIISNETSTGSGQQMKVRKNPLKFDRPAQGLVR